MDEPHLVDNIRVFLVYNYTHIISLQHIDSQTVNGEHNEFWHHNK